MALVVRAGGSRTIRVDVFGGSQTWRQESGTERRVFMDDQKMVIKVKGLHYHITSPLQSWMD